MKKINKERLGSTLDDCLESEGDLTEITAIAHKRVLVWQISEAMKRLRINQSRNGKAYAYKQSSSGSFIKPPKP